MTWETVIGLETHAELATRTKIFCSCTTRFGGEPNTHCCPICTGMPGTLPMVNRKVVEYACRAGLALNCEITRRSRFDRKNYFYPDLPKAYQVSQLYLPIARNGRVSIATAAGEKVVRIHELHMEEDAGKLVHDPWLDQTRADYNRCGVPLVEIVTEPDFRSAEEVIAYLEKLKSILEYLGISDCKMQEGSLRCDVNLSVRPAGSRELGARTEMKNLNSFKAIARAIAYEARRQAELLEEGGRMVQETRRWDDNKDATFSMRSKEDAQDYRYFPEPDIPPLELSEEYLEGLRAERPEMAEERKQRYQTQLGLPEYDAGIITGQKALVDFFEEVTALGVPAKEAANWMLGDMMRRLKEEELEPKDMRLTPATLVKLIGMVQAGRINRNTASKVFRGIFAEDLDPEEWVTVHGLEQIRDERVIAGAVARVLEEHPQSAADYRAGKEKALGFLMGRVMKELKGKADPGAVNALLKSRLETGGSEGG